MTGAGSAGPEFVVEPILGWSRSDPNRPAVADCRRELSYRGLATAVMAAGDALRARGVSLGDRVIVATPNSVDGLVVHLAAIAIGAVPAPVGQVTNDRLAFLVGDCEPRLICVPAVTGELQAALGNRVTISLLRELVAADLPADSASDPASFLASVSRRPDDLVSLMYTTGSTGTPKGVMLSHRGLGAAISHIVEYVGFDRNDREAVVLPLSHSFGLGQAYCTLITGGFLWVNEGLRPLKTVFQAFKQQRITAFSTTPSMLRILLGTYRRPFLESMGALRRMVVNSEPLPPDQAAEVMETFPELDLIAYYGLTEASRSTFLRPKQEAAHGRTVGKAAARVEIEARIEGRPLAVGDEGELCIRGPHLAVGYWRRPDEQAAAFRDGWLHTGDLGVIDKDGYVTITGRLKDQINVGGLKVSAVEVESVIRRHPMVADVAATGIVDPNGLRGEVVAAAVVPRSPALTERDINLFCAERLEAAAQPQRVLFVQTIPRAETGKTLKGELRRLLEGRR